MMKIEDLKKPGRYTDEEIVELAEFFNKERQDRTIRDKQIKKLEDDYKILMEHFPDVHFYVTMKGEYDTFRVDVLDLLDSYFKGDDFEY